MSINIKEKVDEIRQEGFCILRRHLLPKEEALQKIATGESYLPQKKATGENRLHSLLPPRQLL